MADMGDTWYLETESPNKWRRGADIVSGSGQPAFYPLFGTACDNGSYSTPGFASFGDAVDHYDEAVGGLAIVRTYSGGGIGTWNSGEVAAVRANSNATVWHSFKSWNTTDVTNWIANKPDDGIPALITFHHEPENDGWDAAEILLWQQRTSQLMDIKNASGRTDVLCGPILMSSWTLNAASGRDYWRDWYVGPPQPGYTPVGYPTDYTTQDFLAWDPYNPSRNDEPVTYDDPLTTIFDRSDGSIFDVHRVTGLPIAIGEWGSPVAYPLPWGDDVTRAGMVAWANLFQDELLDFYTNEGIKCIACVYWSDYGTEKYSMWDEPIVLAGSFEPYAAASRAAYGIPARGWAANGLPPDGMALSGATASNAAGMLATEATVGEQAGLWRQYYSSSEANAVSDCAWAHGQGLIPWISLKPRNSQGWTFDQMGTGSADAWATSLAASLGALDGPVWVCIHHEAEDDSGSTTTNYKAMQERLLPIFKAHDNIATSIILMGWREAFGSENWDTWCPDPAVFDIYGYDPYNWYGTETGGTAWDEMDKYYADWESWLATKDSTYQHLRQAIAEVGYSDSASQVADPPGTTGSGADWPIRAFDDLKARGGIAFAYFDINAGDIGEDPLRTWKCDDATKAPRLGSVFASGDKYPSIP